MGDVRLLQLMQLSDSALPSGGYAFSNGLEAAHKTGVVPDVRSFEESLVDQLFQVREGEFPFIHSIYAMSSVSRDAFVDLVAWYDAMQLVPAVRRASEVLGRNWVRLMDQLDPPSCATQYRDWLVAAELPVHMTPLFGATLRAAGVTESEAGLLFLHQFIRDQVSAAVRLGIVGPMEAMRIHRKVLATCEDEMDGIEYTDAARWLPQWDVAQCGHDRLYTRLFQN